MGPESLTSECVQRRFLSFTNQMLNINYHLYDFAPALYSLGLAILAVRRTDVNLKFLQKIIIGSTHDTSIIISYTYVSVYPNALPARLLHLSFFFMYLLLWLKPSITNYLKLLVNELTAFKKT